MCDDGECHADSKNEAFDKCCEEDPTKITIVVVIGVVLLLSCIICFCACCGCCPLYKKLCCAPKGGCCVPQEGVTVVEGTPSSIEIKGGARA